MENKKIVVGIAVVLTSIALLIAYQALVVVPQNRIDAEQRKEQTRIQEERAREARRETSLLTCGLDAYSTYSGDWDKACETAGLKPDCTLPKYKSDSMNKRLEEMNDRCVTLYK